MKKKIISVILCVVMIFSVAVAPASAVKNDTARTVISALDMGYPMSNVANVLKMIYQINKMINNFLGIPLLTEKTFAITVDDTIQSVIDNIIDKKGVDFSEVYNILPDFSRSADVISSTLHFDIPLLQSITKELANVLFANDKATLGTLTELFRIWLGVVADCKLQLTPVEGQDGLLRFEAVVTYKDGRVETVPSNICINQKTNEMTGIDGGPAVLGFSMDFDQMYTYTGVNVWQRNFGFCVEYDIFCFLTPYIMHYVTQRIKFVYNDKEWMCQVWKGTYFIANGGEVGFYNRPIGSKGTFYKCASDDELLKMSLEVYHGKDLIFKREPIEHWWVTGFEVDDTCYLPETLTLISTITMKDEEMLEAFTKALDKKRLFIDYETDGLDVTIVW